MFCTNCGEKVPDKSKFCPACGTKLFNAEDAPENKGEAEKVVASPELEKKVEATEVITPKLEKKAEATEEIPCASDAAVFDSKTKVEATAEILRTTDEDKGGLVASDMSFAKQDRDEYSAVSAALEDIIGKNAKYYLTEFEKIERGEKTKFNWAAFFFSFFFCLYRRCGKLFEKYFLVPILIQIVVQIALLVGSESFSLTWISMVGILSAASAFWLFINSIRLGKNFNREYYAHCQTIFLRVYNDNGIQPVLPDMTEPNKKRNHKRSIKIVLPLLIVCGLITAFSLMEYQKESRYLSAVESFDNGDYAKAEEIFSKITGYKDADGYLIECQYQNALVNYDAGRYEDALAVLTTLNGYENSELYIERSLLGRKYALLDDGTDDDLAPAIVEIIVTSSEDVEELMENTMYYKTWYNLDTGETFQLDCYQLNGKYYGIKRATNIDGSLTIDCYYLDDPAETITLSNSYVVFEYIEETIETLTIIYNNSKQSNFLTVTPQEYAELEALDEEAKINQPAYSDETIIEKTLSAFRNKIRSYYSGASVLYHSASYSDAYVDYDWQSQTYTCTMTAEYTTNVFDFWGTSTETYYVTAVFLDTGSNLTMIDFNAY